MPFWTGRYCKGKVAACACNSLLYWLYFLAKDSKPYFIELVRAYRPAKIFAPGILQINFNLDFFGLS